MPVFIYFFLNFNSQKTSWQSHRIREFSAENLRETSFGFEVSSYIYGRVIWNSVI